MSEARAAAVVSCRGLQKIYRQGKVEVPVLLGVDLDVQAGGVLITLDTATAGLPVGAKIEIGYASTFSPPSIDVLVCNAQAAPYICNRTPVAYVADTAPFTEVLHKQHFLRGTGPSRL